MKQKENMWDFKVFVVFIGVFLTPGLASEESCSKLDLLKDLLEKMIRTELNYGQLETNVEIVHSTLNTDLKSAGIQIEALESKMLAMEEDLAKHLTKLEEQVNHTNVIAAKVVNMELGLIPARKVTNCPDEWMGFEGSCYYFGPTDLSFARAQRFCEGHQAYLVNIETPEENNFLRSHLRERKAPKHWVGMSDEAEEGVWRFVPSEAVVTSFDWGHNQPNNYRISNCMAIWESFGYLWVDEPCKNYFRPICEKRANEVSN